MAAFLRFCLGNKPVVLLVTLLLGFYGFLVAPFDWDVPGLARDPVPVDAIPDTGDNQQIVFTNWPGRSPQDVEDQVTYPLSSALQGVPGVRTVRGKSMFGFSSLHVIFEDDVDFYWSRTRILEKLGSLPSGTLPPGVQPQLGPDATALGQVFWYTLEGRDQNGEPAGGWSLHELRSIQDFQVRYALAAAPGVAEVASVGGHVREYQIDVDPDAMRVHGVRIEQIFSAVRASNIDVGARTIEVNGVEYVVRGVGRLENTGQIEQIPIVTRDGTPILIRNVANVTLGPALRRGALDRDGAETVGGVVVVRYGANPLQVIQEVKKKLAELAPGLPSKQLDDGRVSKVTVVPFYDRTELIQETLGTLNDALELQVIVTVLVVVLLLWHLRSAFLISGMLPIAILVSFIGMRLVGVDANVVALSGIAIAIGTMVDMGIVLCERILEELRGAGTAKERLEAVFRGAHEVGGAVLTAVLTTVVSFLPVFALEGAQGKLFQPLAWTKTFALIAAILISLLALPALAHWLIGMRLPKWLRLPRKVSTWGSRLLVIAVALAVLIFLSEEWAPLGPQGFVSNFAFVGLIILGLLGAFGLFLWFYEDMLRVLLRVKLLFLLVPIGLVFLGYRAWQETGTREMPALDEGSFLLMPVTQNHASIGEALEILQLQDKRIRAIPEVKDVVGKIGRVESALDPAPVSMVETLITYHPEWGETQDGTRIRLWRDEIQSPQDIWDDIQAAAAFPGVTTASKDQPINVRRIMLQTGMTSRIGVKVFGPDLEAIQAAEKQIVTALKEVDAVNEGTVFGDEFFGKPYLDIELDRQRLADRGILVRHVQDVIETAIGGKPITTTVEGRERYPVRVRYMRERRDSLEELARILVSTPGGAQIPLTEVAEIRYRPGPQMIRSEEGRLVGYITLGGKEGLSDLEVVEAAQAHLQSKIDRGQLSIPTGVSYRFTGSYLQELRALERLGVAIPFALLLIFAILWLHFRSGLRTALVFSGVFVAWAGGFLMIWLYGQPWFLDAELFGANLREVFSMGPVQMTVAVWVGFLALFGIATDDGVILATYLDQSFKDHRPTTKAEIREAVIEAGKKRIRPCLMTSATTILALLPVLSSTGRGSDVMVPMAIPSFGGMTVVLVTVFVVPVLYCLGMELRLWWRQRTSFLGA